MFPLLLVAAAVLALCILLTWLVNLREEARLHAAAAKRADQASAPAQEQQMEAGNGFALVWRNNYLLLIGILLLLLNLVNTTGEYILGKVVKDWAAVEAASGQADLGALIGSFYAGFLFWVNLAAMLIQLFLVSRIVKYLGVRIGLLILPCISLLTYGTVALVPLLAILRPLKSAENATDYSLQNTLRNMLFLPTSRAEKYKAKQALDTFFVRAGDVISALLVLTGTTLLGFGVQGFAAVNVGLALVWIGVALALGKRFEALTRESSQGS